MHMPTVDASERHRLHRRQGTVDAIVPCRQYSSAVGVLLRAQQETPLLSWQEGPTTQTMTTVRRHWKTTRTRTTMSLMNLPWLDVAGPALFARRRRRRRASRK